MESNEKLLKKLGNGREYRAMRMEVRTDGAQDAQTVEASRICFTNTALKMAPTA